LGRGAIQALETELKAAFDSLALCYFLLGWTVGGEPLELDHDDLARLFSAATGIDMSGDDLLKIGERIYNVERAFNIREGLGRKDDNPPARYIVSELHGKPTIGVDPTKYQAMLDEYYKFKGWDKEGIPTKKKLEELNLGYIANQIRAQ
jgi:aldehyde:ferredoxin oxidoreductase